MGISGSSFISESKSVQPSRIPYVPRTADNLESGEQNVYLYVYDLANGWAGFWTTLLSRFHIDYIWHTSIVVFNKEYSFGQAGVQEEEPGEPKEIILLGQTKVSRRCLYDVVVELQRTTYDHRVYNPFGMNCHAFSNHLCQILTGQHIPATYTTLGEKILRLIRIHYPGLTRRLESLGSGSARYLRN